MAGVIPSVFLRVEENPNCAALDGQVFQPRSVPRAILQRRSAHNGTVDWHEVTGLDAGGAPRPAMACIIDDSGDGACHLVFSGEWRLRFRTSGGATPGGAEWSLEDPRQWGEPYLLVPADESAVIFRPSTHS